MQRSDLTRGGVVNAGLRAVRHHLFPVTVLLVGLIAVYWSYLPALDAPAMFDTTVNLEPLESVQSVADARVFVLTGHGGPLGRPVSLASFALEYKDWPENPASLRHTNVVIHLVNSLLVAWAAFLLAVACSGNSQKSAWAAVLAALIWSASPLLATTSLFIIQRMASLSAMFVLLGLIGHLLSRSLAESRPRPGIVAMTANLVVFTCAAALAKENGALLPGLVLLTEVFLLKKPLSLRPRLWRAWQGIFLFAPTLLIAGYLISRIPYDDTTLLFRDFDAYERLLTQAVILWDYLFNAIVPAMHRLGPFHDDYTVYRSLWDFPVFLSVVGWLAVLGAIFWSARRIPMLGFAAGWFLWAHVLESTVIPLELYFEHRNYLALIGPAIAAGTGIVHAAPHIRRWLIPGLAMFMLLCVFVLFRNSLLWANPLLAAEFWREHHPQSPRASLFFANQLMQQNDLIGALTVLQDYEELPGEAAFAYLQDGTIRCHYGIDNQHENFVKEAVRRLDDSTFSFTLINYLPTMYHVSQDSDCPNFGALEIAEISREMLAREQFGGIPYTRYILHALLGKIHADQGRYIEAVSHYQRSLEARHDPQTLFHAVVGYLESGQYRAGCEFLAQMRARPPSRWPQRTIWMDSIDVYMADIAKAAGVDSCREVVNRSKEQVALPPSSA